MSAYGAGDRASPRQGLERARAAPIAATARRGPQPVSVESAGDELGRRRLERLDWREGSNDLRRLAVCRCARASGLRGNTPCDFEWLLIDGGGRSRADQILALDSAGRYVLATLVDIAKLRWRIERDYQELKANLVSPTSRDEDGAASITHETLCVAAYGLLIAEERPFSPMAPCSAKNLASR